MKKLTLFILVAVFSFMSGCAVIKVDSDVRPLPKLSKHIPSDDYTVVGVEKICITANFGNISSDGHRSLTNYVCNLVIGGITFFGVKGATDHAVLGVAAGSSYGGFFCDSIRISKAKGCKEKNINYILTLESEKERYRDDVYRMLTPNETAVGERLTITY